MQNSNPSKNSRDTPTDRNLVVTPSALPPLDFLQNRPENTGSTSSPKNVMSGSMAAISAIPAIRETEIDPAHQPEAAFRTPTYCPQGSALVVVPGWWPGQSFLVVRTEEERDALIEEGESPGIVWTLPEARKLEGLKPEEKLYLARVKVEFNGQMGRVRLFAQGIKSKC
jgi:hypothetical protein